LLFLSERLHAKRCEQLGLVNRIVPDAELRRAAFELAKSLAEGPAVALGFMKDNLDHALTSDLLSSFPGSGGRPHGKVSKDLGS
jgi:enoyl-CoA hydratase/carnithine racemase